MMFLWLCYFSYEEYFSDWCAYVIAPTRGKAKKMFLDYFNDGFDDYLNVRCRKVKSADGFQPQVCDLQNEVLDALGVSYSKEETDIDWEAY